MTSARIPTAETANWLLLPPSLATHDEKPAILIRCHRVVQLIKVQSQDVHDLVTPFSQLRQRKPLCHHRS